jgi:hypothetical protein
LLCQPTQVHLELVHANHPLKQLGASPKTSPRPVAFMTIAFRRPNHGWQHSAEAPSLPSFPTR